MSSGLHSQVPDDLTPELTERQSQWLEPLPPFSRFMQAVLFYINRFVMKALFKLSVEGIHNVPHDRPFILAPNHTSSLDPAVIAAALSLSEFRRLRWAAREGVVDRGIVRKAFMRMSRVLPIPRRVESLAAALAVLERGESLVWFPEGSRSETGELQPLMDGIGHLATYKDYLILPAIIRGASEVMPPPGRRLKTVRPISITFGEALVANGGEASEEFRDRLTARLQALASRGKN